MMKLERKTITTDILIIGGGTAGCYAALTAAEHSAQNILIVEKADIKRSGCLAAGVNAINAYITLGETPESYVDYVRKDSENVIREDLVFSIAKRLNAVTARIEQLGLPILRDENGQVVSRGKRSIKINGENIKPLLAGALKNYPNIQVLNRVNIIDYIVKNNRVIGAYGFSLKENVFYVIKAKAVICATGGAAGLYKPNNPGFSRHKMWYCPFNTGAGYAMGIRAGAEMTSFEMRFIALRCKDTIAPTGTIAQGIRARQVNGQGNGYIEKYGKPTTSMRLYATVMENRNGQGPCYLETTGITDEQEQQLYKAYLNMAPAQVLKWVEEGTGPKSSNVEIEGTEPYIVGGHAASGYWIDTKRATTLEGLYAAGDVAGGSPKKYVTGCFVEGEVAALSAMSYAASYPFDGNMDGEVEKDAEEKLDKVNRYLSDRDASYTAGEIEEAMQKIMDEYAGGISSGYIVNVQKLEKAAQYINKLIQLSHTLKTTDLHGLLSIYELIDRLLVCKVVISHLAARKETRWRCYQEFADYPQRDDDHWLCYVNSKYEDKQVKIILRKLVGKEEHYEH